MKTGLLNQLTSHLNRTIIGQEEILKKLFIAFLSDGHVLLEGVPGTAKTHIMKNMAATFALSFKRVQFTSDLLPSDITGTMIFNPGTLTFSPTKGPLFNNIILADEINRAPSKVQSALLQAMQEYEVNLGGENHALPRPFHVIATQNPIEHEGTYPLPEAELDRFMLKLVIEYPSKDEELKLLERLESIENKMVTSLWNTAELTEIKAEVSRVFVDERLRAYLCDLVQATRNQASFGLAHIEKFIQWGGSPRATINLLKASKAEAYLQDRDFVIPEDIHAVVKDVLRHRIIPSYEAISENVNTDSLIDDIVEKITIP